MSQQTEPTRERPGAAAAFERIVFPTVFAVLVAGLVAAFLAASANSVVGLLIAAGLAIAALLSLIAYVSRHDGKRGTQLNAMADGRWWRTFEHDFWKYVAALEETRKRD